MEFCPDMFWNIQHFISVKYETDKNSRTGLTGF